MTSKLLLYAWVFLILAIAAAITLRQAQAVDFPSYYYAARALLTSSDPYDVRNLNQIARHDHVTQVWPYLYPPTFVSWFRWLGLLSFSAAQRTWSVILAVSLCASVFAMRSTGRVIARAENQKDVEWPVLFACAALSWPVLVNFANGQANLLVCALVGTGFLLLLQVRIQSVVAFMAAAIVKATPLLLLPYAFYRIKNPAKCAPYSLATIVLVAITTPPVSWSPFLVASRTYTHGATFYENLDTASFRNISFTTFGPRIFGLDTREAYLFGVISVATLTMFLLVTYKRWADRQFGPLVLSLWILLISPIAWVHHAVILLPGLAIATTYDFYRGQFKRMSVLLALVCLLNMPRSWEGRLPIVTRNAIDALAIGGYLAVLITLALTTSAAELPNGNLAATDSAP